MNRDPIEEDGGLNLYSFVFNDSINKYDMLGMFDVKTIKNLPRPQFSLIFDDLFPIKNAESFIKGKVDQLFVKALIRAVSINAHVKGVININGRRKPFLVWKSLGEEGHLSITGDIESPRIKKIDILSLKLYDIVILINDDPVRVIRQIEEMPTFAKTLINIFLARPSSISKSDSGFVMGHLKGFIELCSKIKIPVDEQIRVENFRGLLFK